MYADILDAIGVAAGMNFEDASVVLENCVNADTAFIETLKQIGAIPEFLAHDFTEKIVFQTVTDYNGDTG